MSYVLHVSIRSTLDLRRVAIIDYIFPLVNPLRQGSAADTYAYIHTCIHTYIHTYILIERGLHYQNKKRTLQYVLHRSRDLEYIIMWLQDRVLEKLVCIR